MSASSNRFSLFDVINLLSYHTIPESSSGLGEAVLWLRTHAPLSTCRERLESALQKMADAREELDGIERQLTSVARAIEGDDRAAQAIEDIFQFDCELAGRSEKPTCPDHRDAHVEIGRASCRERV